MIRWFAYVEGNPLSFIDPFGLDGRHEVFREIKRELGIPANEVPQIVRSHLYDKTFDGGKLFLYDKNGGPIMTRDYIFNCNGKTIVIQEHSAGHMFQDSKGKWVFQEKGHFNVRDLNGKTFPGAREHYNFNSRVDPMKYWMRKPGGAGGMMPRGGNE